MPPEHRFLFITLRLHSFITKKTLHVLKRTYQSVLPTRLHILESFDCSELYILDLQMRYFVYTD